MTDAPTDNPNSTANEQAAQPVNANLVKSLRKEATERRRQLRDAEAERDALASQLSAAQSKLGEWQAAEVEKIISGVVQSPATLKQLGYDPSAYVNEDFTIDAEAARSAAEELRDTHGLSAPSDGPSELAAEVAAELEGRHGPRVPAKLLRGATGDELREHRDAIRDFLRYEYKPMPIVSGENAGGAPLEGMDWLKKMLSPR